MDVFQWLELWFEENKQALLKRNIIFTFSEKTQTDNPAQYVDIDTETRIARFTIWETGDCDFEILECENEKIVFWENRNIKSNKEFVDFLNKGFSQL